MDEGRRQVRLLARNFWNLKSRAPYLDGIAASLDGRATDAVAAFARAAAIAREMGMPNERARALVEQSRLLDGPEASTMRSEAHELLARLGATPLETATGERS